MPRIAVMLLIYTNILAQQIPGKYRHSTMYLSMDSNELFLHYVVICVIVLRLFGPARFKSCIVYHWIAAFAQLKWYISIVAALLGNLWILKTERYE